MAAPFTAGMNNNNPGNIKYDPSIPWQGQVGPSTNKDQGDPQVVFDSQAAGMRALARNVMTKYNGGATTIQQLIAGPGGWTPGYTPGAQGVASAAGLPLDQPIDMSNPAVLAQVMRGIVTQEHGPASSYYTDQMIDDGISAAAGHPIPPANIPVPTNGLGVADAGITAPVPLASGPAAGNPVADDMSVLGMQNTDPTTQQAADTAAARLASPSGLFSTGDELAFDPVTTADIGGTATAPTFDAGYDPATGTVRPFATPYAEEALHPSGTTDPGALADLALNSAAGINASGSPDDRDPATLAAAGPVYTGQGIAGTVQLPANVRPNVTIPSLSAAPETAGSGYQGYIPGGIASAPSASSSPSAGIASPAAPYGGPYNEIDALANAGSDSNGNTQSWSDLASSFGSAPSGGSTVAMNDPAAQFVTQYSQQLNPAYTAWLNSTGPGSAAYGVDNVDTPSLDAAGNVVLPSSYLGASTPAPAKYISVAKKVPAAVPPVTSLATALVSAGLHPADAASAAQASAAQAPTLAQQVAAMTPAQLANQNAASIAVLKNNQTSYSPGNGATLMPTVDINGQIRNTYADSSSSGGTDISHEISPF